jgi:4-diphosphocytidyl-2C-methyl-D-erythritol kinase
VQEKPNQEESKEDRHAAAKSTRMVAKKNQEASQNFINNLTTYCVQRDQKVDELNSIWEEQFLRMITGAVSELTNTSTHINEKVIRHNANL